MTRTRAADDLATIRARMEQLRHVHRPRAADDFVTIRERMEELRRERAQVSADKHRGSVSGPRPYSVVVGRHRPASGDSRRLFARPLNGEVSDIARRAFP